MGRYFWAGRSRLRQVRYGCRLCRLGCSCRDDGAGGLLRHLRGKSNLITRLNIHNCCCDNATTFERRQASCVGYRRSGAPTQTRQTCWMGPSHSFSFDDKGTSVIGFDLKPHGQLHHVTHCLNSPPQCMIPHRKGRLNCEAQPRAASPSCSPLSSSQPCSRPLAARAPTSSYLVRKTSNSSICVKFWSVLAVLLAAFLRAPSVRS